MRTYRHNEEARASADPAETVHLTLRTAGRWSRGVLRQQVPRSNVVTGVLDRYHCRAV